MAETTPDAAGSLEAIRATIDLLENDLNAMIRNVQRAADQVRLGIQSSAVALGAIKDRSEALTSVSRGATQAATQLAAATQEFVGSSGEISRQVHDANGPTDDAFHAATAAGRSVDGLKSSSAEIGNVIKLIANIAKQTHLLALNATNMS